MAQYGDQVQLEAFKGWLSDQYSDVHAVEAAWNLYPGDTLVHDLNEAVALSVNPNRHLGYGVNRDRTRFVSDITIARTSYIYDLCRSIDPDHYYFIGSHQLLYNQANLGWDQVRFPAPLFHGDTIRVETEVMELRESKSRPRNGIVTFEHRAYKQDGTLVGTCRRTALMHRKP